MAAAREKGSAGGKPPAGSLEGHWIDWRERRDRPVYAVTLWPHRSLTPGVRKALYAVLAAGIVLPMAALAGTMAFWGMLPFVVLPVVLAWASLKRNDFDGRLTEDLTVWRDEVRVVRREPKGRELRWQAEPMKVRVRLHKEPVESYLTLTGGGREIELGAFLSPAERRRLAEEVEDALTRAIRA